MCVCYTPANITSNNTTKNVGYISDIGIPKTQSVIKKI